MQQTIVYYLSSLSICSVEGDYAVGPESFYFLRWNRFVSKHKSCWAASTDRPGSTRGADSLLIRFLWSIRGLWLKMDEVLKGRWSVGEMTAEEKRYNYLHLQCSNKADKHRQTIFLTCVSHLISELWNVHEPCNTTASSGDAECNKCNFLQF